MYRKRSIEKNEQGWNEGKLKKWGNVTYTSYIYSRFGLTDKFFRC